jgi:hypothetical protein
VNASSPALGPFLPPTPHQWEVFALTGLWIFVTEVLWLEMLRSPAGPRRLAGILLAAPPAFVTLWSATPAIQEGLSGIALQEAPLMLALPHPVAITRVFLALLAGGVPLLASTLAGSSDRPAGRAIVAGALASGLYSGLLLVPGIRPVGPGFVFAALALVRGLVSLRRHVSPRLILATIGAAVLTAFSISRADVAAVVAAPEHPAFVALATVVVPIAIGLLAGLAWLRLRPGRLRAPIVIPTSLFTGLGLSVVPAVLTGRVGTWDAAFVGMLGGCGFLCSAHEVFARKGGLVLLTTTLGLGLVALEVCCRLLLTPPRFEPVPLRFFQDPAAQKPLSRGAGFGRTTDLACRIAFGEPVPTGDGLVRQEPTSFAPNKERPRRVLHVGDSVPYGFLLTDAQTMEAQLSAMEPTTEHINAGIRGTAPDDYLAVTRAWMSRVPIEMVVMYLNEPNDLFELDQGHSCTGGLSLLSYEGAAPELRPRAGGRIRASLLGLLGIDSPPPYLIRWAQERSAVAALLSALLIQLRAPDRYSDEGQKVALAHADRILGAARDELRKAGVTFVVVDLPQNVEAVAPDPLEAVAQKLGIPVFDPRTMLRQARAQGEPVYLTDGIHFSPRGSALMARWLHENVTGH